MVKDYFKEVETERKNIEDKLKELIKSIGDIPIAHTNIMPYGWRKAAKGRTVWRIVEEVITQGLECRSREFGFDSVNTATSEVAVYDVKIQLDKNKVAFINIKSAVKGGKKNKDDISKANNIVDFYEENKSANLYVATITISFNEDMTIGLDDCTVFPTAWIPDIYVNPSNNGNLQSSKYKDINLAKKRTNEDFLECLRLEIENANNKKKKKSTKE